MTDIKVSTLGVPRRARNKRIYSEFKTERITIGTPSTFVDTQKNIQAKTLSYDDGDFTSRSISVDFQTAFNSQPSGWVKAYRYETREGGGLYVANAVYYVADSDWLTNIGFDIVVEDYESLNGLFIEYSFTEQTSDEE